MTITYSIKDILPKSTGHDPILVNLELTATGDYTEIEWLKMKLDNLIPTYKDDDTKELHVNKETIDKLKEKYKDRIDNARSL